MNVLRFIFKFLGNFIWKLFGGVAYSAVWFAFSLFFAVTIVGFPLAAKCFRIGYLVWKPFGKSAVNNYLEYPIINTLWATTFGGLLALSAIASAILSATSILGIPLVKQWFKVAKLSLAPFGAIIR